MVLESDYIEGGGGREGTNRKEGGNLLDGPEGKGVGAEAGICVRRLRLCGQPGAASPPPGLPHVYCLGIFTLGAPGLRGAAG